MARFIVPVLVALVAVPAHGQPDADADSAATAREAADWLLLPFVSYSPDTKIAVGGVAGYYRAAPPGRSPSSVQATMTVTQRRQASVQVAPELYMDGGRWRLQGEGIVSKFPDSFYGIGGDTPRSAEEPYTARYGQIDLRLQRRLRPSLRLGPRVFGRVGTIESTAGPDEPTRIGQGRVAGTDGGTTLGGGLSGLWDTRDNLYDPASGTYAATAVLWHSAAWGSDYTFVRLRAEGRHYWPLGPGVMAGNAYAEAVVGDAPFQLLPLLGGSRRMRGYRLGRFRDDVYWTAQAEYRFPLFWRFGGTVFGAVGEVGPRLGPALVAGVEAAVGLGGRFRLTDDGLNGRLDLAYSPEGLEVYMSLGEAF